MVFEVSQTLLVVVCGVGVFACCLCQFARMCCIPHAHASTPNEEEASHALLAPNRNAETRSTFFVAPRTEPCPEAVCWVTIPLNSSSDSEEAAHEPLTPATPSPR